MFGDGYYTKYQFKTGFGVFVLYDIYREIESIIYPCIYGYLTKFDKQIEHSRILDNFIKKGICATVDLRHSSNSFLYRFTHNDIKNRLQSLVDKVNTKEQYTELNNLIKQINKHIKEKISDTAILKDNNISVYLSIFRTPVYSTPFKTSVSMHIKYNNELLLQIYTKDDDIDDEEYY